MVQLAAAWCSSVVQRGAAVRCSMLQCIAVQVWCAGVKSGVVWCAEGAVTCHLGRDALHTGNAKRGCGVCGVVCRRRCYQKAKAGMSTHGYR